jgi:4'-phosphopantetheinyl transferase EntD
VIRLEDLLPASVSVAATERDRLDAPLFPVEEAAMSRAVDSRRREFATGRACARSALERWGLSQRAIPVGSDGEPQWPEQIVGSITHCAGFRACAVARRRDILTIGIDAEPSRPLREGVLDAVASRDERVLLRRLADAVPDVQWDCLLFSAKESVYKALFPFAAGRLGFKDAALSIDPRAGTFLARPPTSALSPPGWGSAPLAGRWKVEAGLVLTAVAVEGNEL